MWTAKEKSMTYDQAKADASSAKKDIKLVSLSMNICGLTTGAPSWELDRLDLSVPAGYPLPANPGRLVHDESSRTEHLAVNSFLPPVGFCKQQQNLLRNILSSFWKALGSQGLKTASIWNKKKI